MPYLVQILLPIYDNQGSKLASEFYSRVRSELTERFGGLTAYTRAPAEGLWGIGDEVRMMEQGRPLRCSIIHGPTCSR
jgi:hypothetical protein